jgi:hypothetical protein
MYFLLCAILQLIPGLSPTSWFTTVAPLVFVLTVNAIKEGYDDVQRHKNDEQINRRMVVVVTSEGGEKQVECRDVVAGDIIKVGVLACVSEWVGGCVCHLRRVRCILHRGETRSDKDSRSQTPNILYKYMIWVVSIHASFSGVPCTNWQC